MSDYCKHEWSKGKMFFGKPDCPYCEIDRLKLELEEARVENSHLWVRVESGEAAAYEHGKAEARQEAARECYIIAQNILVRAMKRDNFIGNAMDDLLDEIKDKFGLEVEG